MSKIPYKVELSCKGHGCALQFDGSLSEGTITLKTGSNGQIIDFIVEEGWYCPKCLEEQEQELDTPEQYAGTYLDILEMDGTCPECCFERDWNAETCDWGECARTENNSA